MSKLGDRFSNGVDKLIESGELEGSFADFVQLSGKNLELRAQPYYEWRRNRMEQGVWHFSTEFRSSPGTQATVIDEAGNK